VFFNVSGCHHDRLHSVCRVCQQGRHKEWRVKNPDNLKDAALERAYGITRLEYNGLLEFQNGVCRLCGNPPTKKRLAVDHDHKTGAIRALLCWHCNREKVGSHTIESLMKVLNYLQSPIANLYFGFVRTVPSKKSKRKLKTKPANDNGRSKGD
jgi:hypothetical protein